uniref:Uncharacterized protein n=1 Tax=Arundo donax TaxID=35708 RepID=A0A0A9DCK2_ARUDO
MPSSKDPIEVKVFVGSDESLGAFAGATVQRLPWQAQEALQSIPFELLNPSFCADCRADYVELAVVHRHIHAIRQQLINLIDSRLHEIVDQGVVDRLGDLLPLEVLGDDLELLLDGPIHDAVDGVGARVLVAEVHRVLLRLHAARRRAHRCVRRHQVHAAVKQEIVHVDVAAPGADEMQQIVP